jgi:hypothetical protein
LKTFRSERKQKEEEEKRKSGAEAKENDLNEEKKK